MSKVAKRYENLTDCRSPEELLARCGLNWEPEIQRARTLFTDPETGNQVIREDHKHYAIVHPKSGAPLGFATDRFRANSHIKLVHDLWPLVKHGSATPDRVSVWDGGGRIALQFRCHELDVKVGPKSVVSPLLTLVVNHDAEGADRGFFADFDYWCKNQAGLVAKIQGAGVKHSSGIISRYEELLEDRIRSMRGSRDMHDRYALMGKMADSGRTLRGRDLMVYFARALELDQEAFSESFWNALAAGKPDAAGKVLAAVLADYRADDHGVPGSVWHAYSAVTRYTTHTEGRSEATRSERSLLGSQKRYVKAFTEAAQLVSA